MRKGSLWSNVVFEKEIIVHEFDFETSDLAFDNVSKSSIWEHTTSLLIIISQLRRPFELKFSQVCYFMHMLRYTKWEDWSLKCSHVCFFLHMLRYTKWEGWSLKITNSVACVSLIQNQRSVQCTLCYVFIDWGLKTQNMVGIISRYYWKWHA